MTTLRVTGQLGGTPVELRWEDGELSGTEAAVRLVRATAETGVTLPGSGGMPDARAGLGDSYAALLTIRDALDRMEVMEGEAVGPDEAPAAAARGR
jgi:hypothetical protein